MSDIKRPQGWTRQRRNAYDSTARDRADVGLQGQPVFDWMWNKKGSETLEKSLGTSWIRNSDPIGSHKEEGGGFERTAGHAYLCKQDRETGPEGPGRAFAEFLCPSPSGRFRRGFTRPPKVDSVWRLGHEWTCRSSQRETSSICSAVVSLTPVAKPKCRPRSTLSPEPSSPRHSGNAYTNSGSPTSTFYKVQCAIALASQNIWICIARKPAFVGRMKEFADRRYEQIRHIGVYVSSHVYGL